MNIGEAKLAQYEQISRAAFWRAAGYLDLAKMQRELGGDDTDMRMAAARELARLTDDDELIDAMYDADMRDMEQHGEI